MLIAPDKDRRKSSRQSCPKARLRVGGRDAVLVDWSFGGLGLRVDSGIGLEVSEQIAVEIHDPVGALWEALGVVVRRIEADGVVGVEFQEDDANVERVVIRLLRSSLADVKNPESQRPAADTAANGGNAAGTGSARPPAGAGQSDDSLSEVLLSEFD